MAEVLKAKRTTRYMAMHCTQCQQMEIHEVDGSWYPDGKVKRTYSIKCDRCRKKAGGK